MQIEKEFKSILTKKKTKYTFGKKTSRQRDQATSWTSKTWDYSKLGR